MVHLLVYLYLQATNEGGLLSVLFHQVDFQEESARGQSANEHLCDVVGESGNDLVEILEVILTVVVKNVKFVTQRMFYL